MNVRNLARVILVDPQDRVLLLRYQHESVDPRDPGLTTYWVPPGGGLQAGESFPDAAKREVLEETGIRIADAGRWVWTREVNLMRRGEETTYHERYFLTKTDDTVVRPTNPDADSIVPAWWSRDQIRSSAEVFLPGGLAGLLDDLSSHGPPAEPRYLNS